MTSVHISPLPPSHAAAAVDLANDALGAGYMTADEISDLTPNNHCAIACRDDVVLGVVMARCCSGADLLRNAPDGHASTVATALPALAGAASVGHIRIIAVHPSARGQGVGGLLLDDALRWLGAQPVTMTCAYAWWDGDTCHSLPLLQSRGFAEVTTIDDFWHRDSITRGYACPHCEAPCRCRASIMLRPT